MWDHSHCRQKIKINTPRAPCPGRIRQPASGCVSENTDWNDANSCRHGRLSSRQGCVKNSRVPSGTMVRQNSFTLESDCLHAVAMNASPQGPKKKENLRVLREF